MYLGRVLVSFESQRCESPEGSLARSLGRIWPVEGRASPRCVGRFGRLVIWLHKVLKL
jgi:hypothetical protein